MSTEDACEALERQEREALQGTSVQDQRDAFFTPQNLAARIVAVVRERLPTRDVRVLEPACGAGTFLVEWVRSFPSGEREQAVSQCFGIDIDERAALLTRLRLWLLSNGRASWHMLECNVVVGDALDLLESGQADLFTPTAMDRVVDWPQSFDVIVGNPPFGANSSSYQAGSTGLLYMQFTALAIQKLAEAGAWSFILPQSFLAAETGHDLRMALLNSRRLSDLILIDRNAFTAKVDTCAPVVVGHSDGINDESVVTVRSGDGVGLPVRWATDATSWGFLLAASQGVPSIKRTRGTKLGSIAKLWVPHRDWFYEVKSIVGEAQGDNALRVLGVGTMSPLAVRPGEQTVGGKRYREPAVPAIRRPYSVEPGSGQILVAPQSALLKCVPDLEARFLPLTPVFAVICPEDLLWEVTAFLQGPVANGLLAQDFAGAAMGSTAIRATSAAIRALPVPLGEPESVQAGDMIRACTLSGETWSENEAKLFAGLCCAASAIDPAAGAIDWWLARYIRMVTK